MSAVFSDILSRVENASRVIVMSHDRPDGDAIGSSLALGLLLERLGKEVVVLNHDEVPESLKFLPKVDCIRQPGGDWEADLVFAVDSAGVDRIGKDVWADVPDEAFLINVDHHVSNTGFGQLNHVDSKSPATGQIIFQMCEEAGWEVGADVAELLYAAISTDTGSFRYPSTTAETMRIGGELLKAGVDAGKVNQMLYENYPRRRVEALRILLQDLRFDFDDRVASVQLPLSTTKELALGLGDTEGVIDVIRAIDSVIIAVFFEELPDGKIRVSSRSKDPRFSVGEICAEFGGGGHTLAAGARLPGPIDVAVDRFVAQIYHTFETNWLVGKSSI